MNLNTSAQEALSINVQGVNKYFSTQAGQVPALQNINLHIPAGQFVSIIGKSGSGKSTLINMLTGIDRPSSGNILVGSTDLHQMKEGQLSVWRGFNMGVVFQFFQLLPVLTLAENILLPMDLCGKIDPAEREKTACELLDLVGLKDFANKYPGEVSGGQQQSAAIARALANNPPIIMADEPTGNLDSASAEIVFGIFERLVSEGKTIVMVTHDANLAKRANRTVILSDGQLVDESIARAFADLPHPTLLQLTKAAQCVTFTPGQPIHTPDDNGPAVWVIVSGAAATTSSPSGWHAGEFVSSTQLHPREVLLAGPEEGAVALKINTAELPAIVAASPALQSMLTMPGRNHKAPALPLREAVSDKSSKPQRKRRFLWF